MNCNINLCPVCKLKHEKEHIIINYDGKNYICNKHYKIYTKYCNECKLNICMKCEKDHKNHKSIYYGEIFLDNDNNNNELREYIDKLKYKKNNNKEIRKYNRKYGNIL